MVTTQTQAIRSAEQAFDTYVDRWLDQLTDYDDAVGYTYMFHQAYQKKNNFLVSQISSQWLITASTPSFFPDCPLVGYLEQDCFNDVSIEDEYNLLLSVPHPTNSLDDEDYVAECFDKALVWLAAYTVWKAAEAKVIQAQQELEQAYKELEAIC